MSSTSSTWPYLSGRKSREERRRHAQPEAEAEASANADSAAVPILCSRSVASPETRLAGLCATAGPAGLAAGVPPAGAAWPPPQCPLRHKPSVPCSISGHRRTPAPGPRAGAPLAPGPLHHGWPPRRRGEQSRPAPRHAPRASAAAVPRHRPEQGPPPLASATAGPPPERHLATLFVFLPSLPHQMDHAQPATNCSKKCLQGRCWLDKIFRTAQ